MCSIYLLSLTISFQSLRLAYHILWAADTGNAVLGIETQQICCASTRSPWGSPLFLSTWGTLPT